MPFYGSERTLWLNSGDPELVPVLLRPQEIPGYVADGSLDCGLSGWDWINESQKAPELSVLANLMYSKRSFRPVKWVLAVSEDSPWRSVQDLREAKPHLRVSTELMRTTEDWLAEQGIRAKVDLSWGATEAKPPIFADAIVDCTETGASLRANRLVVLATILESTSRFFANKAMMRDPNALWKRTKMESIALLLKSCLAAETRVSISVLCKSVAVADDVEKNIPAGLEFFRGTAGDKVSFEISCEQERVRDLVPVLARIGASQIGVKRLDMWYSPSI